MAERIHTTDAYRNVYMLEVMNEPVHASEYPSQAADMIQNFYPNAWTRIRNKESDLGVAQTDLLNIQFMVSCDLTRSFTSSSPLMSWTG